LSSAQYVLISLGPEVHVINENLLSSKKWKSSLFFGDWMDGWIGCEVLAFAANAMHVDAIYMQMSIHIFSVLISIIYFFLKRYQRV
jgi:hypothetical protein